MSRLAAAIAANTAAASSGGAGSEPTEPTEPGVREPTPCGGVTIAPKAWAGRGPRQTRTQVGRGK